MRIYLEKGNTNEDGSVDFVRWVGLFAVDMKITLSRSEWEELGEPPQISLLITPDFS